MIMFLYRVRLRDSLTNALLHEQELEAWSMTRALNACTGIARLKGWTPRKVTFSAQRLEREAHV